MSLDASVIIAAYNKGEEIGLTLTGFARQSFPRDRYEIIIVDDGSTDNTREVVASFADRCPIVYRFQPNAGRSIARNRGITLAQGNVIIFNDAEAIPDLQFVEAHVKAHDRPDDVAALGCKYGAMVRWRSDFTPWYLPILARVSADDPAIMARIEETKNADRVVFLTQAELEADFNSIRKWSIGKPPHNGDAMIALYGDKFEGLLIPWIMFVTVNASVKRSVLDRVGLFDETYSGWGVEDIELGYRLSQNGVNYVYEPDAINFHQMHYVNKDRLIEEHTKNFALLCTRHPVLEVFLLWRNFHAKINLTEYNDLVREYYQLRANGFDRIADDYLYLSKKVAREFTASHGIEMKLD